MKKTALIVIVLLLLGLALTAYLMYTHEMPDIVSKTPDYTVTATEILTEFDTDVVSASKKYIDKIIQLSGTVKDVDTSGSVIMAGPDMAGEIIMAIDPRHKKTLSVNTKGKAAIIQGICSSYTKDEASPDDMLAGLGATLRFRSGGIKSTDK